jgi:uncharacterized protein (TIGR02058 family)
MTKTAYLLQTGMGVDLHGTNDTSAACRAVDHAIHHNSLLFLGEIGLTSAEQIHIDVTIASPHPDQVDTDAVAATLPVGVVSVATQTGGMLTGGDDPALIALAAVRVSVERD